MLNISNYDNNDNDNDNDNVDDDDNDNNNVNINIIIIIIMIIIMLMMKAYMDKWLMGYISYLDFGFGNSTMSGMCLGPTTINAFFTAPNVQVNCI